MVTTFRTATLLVCVVARPTSSPSCGSADRYAVLYHQPDKLNKTKEDLDARKENLERIKRQHGID